MWTPNDFLNGLDVWLAFNNISVISGQLVGNNERLCALEPRFRLKRSPPQASYKELFRKQRCATEQRRRRSYVVCLGSSLTKAGIGTNRIQHVSDADREIPTRG